MLKSNLQLKGMVWVWGTKGIMTAVRSFVAGRALLCTSSLLSPLLNALHAVQGSPVPFSVANSANVATSD